jgi:predicted MFS family arabinose efflux permease
MADGNFRRLARNRDFTVLWVGQAVSELGTAMSLFVFPLLAYAITGSAVGAASVVGALALGRVLVALPAGALVDRWNRRHVMVLTSGTGALLYASLAAAQLVDALTLAHLMVAALLTGVAASFFAPAETAAIRTVVTTADLPTAMSQNQARTHLADLVGAPLAGVLYSVARWIPFVFDAVTYAIACLAVSRIRTPLPPPQRPSRTRLRSDIREGLGFVWGQPVMRVIASNAALLNATFGAYYLIVLLRMVDAGVHPAAIGAAEGAAGVAGILGALAGPSLINRLPTGWLTIATLWVLVLALVPTVFTVDPWIVGGCMAAALFLLPMANAGIGAYRIAITPDEIQGRASTATMFLAELAQPAGPPVGGILLAGLGGPAATAAVLALSAVGALLVTLSRSIRSVPRPDAWTTPYADAARSRN